MLYFNIFSLFLIFFFNILFIFYFFIVFFFIALTKKKQPWPNSAIAKKKKKKKKQPWPWSAIAHDALRRSSHQALGLKQHGGADKKRYVEM